MENSLDIIGERFGRLTILNFVGRNKHSKKLYECLCDCGVTKIVCIAELNNGDTKSCGCYGKEQRINSVRKHGLSHKNNTEYEIWKGMKARCYNKNHIKFPDYGGRGIIVCERWFNSFENFFKDIGLRPTPLHSLDRFPDTNGNYELSNCRWATWEEQSRNKRNNRYFSMNGENMIMEDWAKYFGVHQTTLWEQLESKNFETVYNFYLSKSQKLQ